MLIKEQNNSHQSSLLMGPNGFFLKKSTVEQFQVIVSNFFLKDYGRFDF